MNRMTIFGNVEINSRNEAVNDAKQYPATEMYRKRGHNTKFEVSPYYEEKSNIFDLSGGN